MLCLFILGASTIASADSFYDDPPLWEPLLWGGKVGQSPPKEQASSDQSRLNNEGQTSHPYGGYLNRGPQSGDTSATSLSERSYTSTGSSDVGSPADFSATGLHSTTVPPKRVIDQTREDDRASFEPLELKNIPRLYVTPHLPGEGVWECRGLPALPDGSPAMYKTSYRPSAKYANAIVHMLLFDMKRLSMKLYLGSTEPGASKGTSAIESDKKSGLLAITNALWKQRHSGEAGTIFRGSVVKKLFPGMATLAVYKDGSADILEWNDGIPVSLISDAKQLKHLIVKDGKVVESVIKGGQRADSEIGMGFLLVEDESASSPSSSYYPYYWGYYGGGGGSPTHTSGEDWFIATRSAFGVRKDGNLVFAIGHHISTKDLAKALVLAGCERAMHGDANPHNVLANLYFNSGNGDVSKKVKLSPDQRSDTLNRYVERSYTSDFFAFFTIDEERDSS
ncbi:MAG: hypothetical protein HY913_03475 [Desulfomonile tiedjei]|nr:hypothetical protein [Desulfomonile tiedjei]